MLICCLNCSLAGPTIQPSRPTGHQPSLQYTGICVPLIFQCTFGFPSVFPEPWGTVISIGSKHDFKDLSLWLERPQFKSQFCYLNSLRHCKQVSLHLDNGHPNEHIPHEMVVEVQMRQCV